MTPQFSRRDMLKLSAAGVLGASMSGWLPVLARAAQGQPQARGKSVVLLWMDGGPSHKDTFDLRPGTDNGGPFKAIDTSVPGMQISEHFPKLAPLMNHAAIIRSMSTGEGSHGRAKYFMHTGYKEGSGGIVHPSIGAICSNEIGRPGTAIPNFVSIGNRAYGSGFLGARHAPLIVNDPQRGLENVRPTVELDQFRSRIGLLEEMEAGFHRQHQSDVDAAHHATYQGAVNLVMDRGGQAFDISTETAATRDAYGRTKFGEGCLMARKLIEAGVAFVEVTLGGWDTHANNFERVQQLSSQVDPAMSQLAIDLRSRGLLDNTLIIWMGEFGRTPRINVRGPKPGRDHYPRAWSTVLMGGGIRGGQVIGRLDREAAAVEERPVNTLDFMATICRIVGIDYNKVVQTPIGRPIRIVDRGANPIQGII